MSDAIVLYDVDSPYLEAFEGLAAERGLHLELPSEPARMGRRRTVVLCVLQIRRDPGDVERARKLQKHLGEAPLVLLAGPGAVENAFHAAHLGARDLIALPAEPGAVARRALGACRVGGAGDEFPEIVGCSSAARRLREQVRQVSPTSSTVLLTGETGSGKGVVARSIHRLSARRECAFVHVDCASLAPSVIESELFGHERGAFTGAVGRRPGRLELAGDGTLFLDEIGELDCGLQAKFLRVLEDREYDRVGGTGVLQLRARVVAATNRDLPREVEAGRFRADLYYRLRVLHVCVPSLVSRLADLPQIVEGGLDEICQRVGMPRPKVDESFCRRLMEHEWPGNLRELMNVLEAVVVRTRSPRLSEEDADRVLTSGLPGDEEAELDPACFAEDGDEEMQRVILTRLLAATGGNVARTARRLGIPRSTLRYRIRRLELGHRIPRD